MLTVKLLVLELGALLLYAGITGKGVGALLRGDNTQTAPNRSLTGASSTATPNTGTSSAAPQTTSPQPQGLSGQNIRNTVGFPQVSTIGPAAFGTIGQ